MRAEVAEKSYQSVHFCIKIELYGASSARLNDVDRVSPVGIWVGLVAPKTFLPFPDRVHLYLRLPDLSGNFTLALDCRGFGPYLRARLHVLHRICGDPLGANR